MRIEWLPIVARDRESRITCIGDRNPWAAIDLDDAIEVAVRRLTAHPRMGRPGRHRGTREFVVTGIPYVIAYRIEGSVVVILRLLHGAQRWPTQL